MSYNMMGSAAYRRDDVLTASPLRLVVLTMNGFLNRAERARRAVEARDLAGYRTHLNTARAIVCELLGALDRNTGGEIAENLGSLYEFMLANLLKPGVAPDLAALSTAAELMKKIKEGFDVILAAGAEQHTVSV